MKTPLVEFWSRKGVTPMPTFNYEARYTRGSGEQTTEWGTVVAKDEKEAEEKIVKRGMVLVSLRRISGLKGLLKSFAADIR